MVAEYLNNFVLADFSEAQEFSSLKSFFETKLKGRFPHQTILETGCGRGELTKWLNSCGYSCIGVDRQKSALAGVPFIQHDLLKPLDRKFDLIIDSHLFHCLVFDKERELYLKNMINSLSENGHMLIECIGNSNKLSYQNFLIQDNGVIWARTEKKLSSMIQMGSFDYVPFRRMTTVSSIEFLAHQCGFQIKQLTFERGLSFSYHNFGEEIVFELVSIILSK